MSFQSDLPKCAVLSLALAAALTASAAHAADTGKALAVKQARGLIAGHLSALQGNSEDAFEARDAVVDKDGSEHVRFDRTYRGLHVVGGDVVVKSQRGQLHSVLLTLRSKLRPSLAARLGKDEAAVEAGARFGDRIEQVRGNDLVVYARGAKPVLAYEVTLQGEAGDNHSGLMSYYIDAISGKVLDVQDLIQTAAATGVGKSLYYGDLSISTDKKSETKYDLIDTTRGSGSVYDAKGGVVSGLFDILSTTGSATLMSDTDNVWGNHTTGDRATVAADIHYGVGVTWDYFKNVHGRS
ncbi:peptidase M4 family protein, partial [Lysobacter sp. 2RAB21]